MNDCKEWLKDPLVNPRTRRKIKANGSVYKELQKECEDIQYDECVEWLKDPLINPRTKRYLDVGDPMYYKFEKACKGIEIPVKTKPPSDECEEWLKNPLVNPRTGRKINVGGSVFKKLDEECEGIEIPTPAHIIPSPYGECVEWLKNPLVNPRTRRKINVGGSVYKKFEKECKDIIDNDIDDEDIIDDYLEEDRHRHRHLEEYRHRHREDIIDDEDIGEIPPTIPRPIPVQTIPFSSDECEEWLKDPLVNPRTRRKIKVDGSLYKKLEKECEVPSMTIALNVQESCSKVEITGFPTTSIEPIEDIEILSNNNARVNKNEYLSSLKFKRSTNKGNYQRAFGNVFRNVVITSDNDRIFNFFNSIIKYVPNFVHIFNDFVSEPYIDINNDNFFVDKTMLFDIVMIQIVLNQFPDKNVHVKNPKLCVLKCDHVTYDLVTINKTKYFRPHSQYRYCLTPNSYIVSKDRDDFLKKFLRSARFASEITNDSELVKRIKIVSDSSTYLHHDNPGIQKLLRKLSVSNDNIPIIDSSGKGQKITNTFPFPLNIENDTFYFNVVSTVQEHYKNRAKLFEDFIDNHKEGTYDFTNKINAREMGFFQKALVPFVLLLHRNFQPKILSIDPEIVKGPYVVNYNSHKRFYSTEILNLNSVSYIDPLFFEMFEVKKTCKFYNTNLSKNNASQINLHNLKDLYVNSFTPNFIFDVKVDSVDTIDIVCNENDYYRARGSNKLKFVRGFLQEISRTRLS
jgi:2-cysteine adaptor domain